jgi:putative membrane protein
MFGGDPAITIWRASAQRQADSGSMAFENISERVKNGAMRLIARTLAARRLKILPAGLENIPAHGPVLFVARHYHHLFDGVALYATVPRPLHIVVATDWAAKPLARKWIEIADRVARWPVVVRSEAIGPNRSSFSKVDIMRYQRVAFRDSVQLLAEGRVLLIFPEGFPNVDPHFTPKESGVPFLPFKDGFLTICKAAEKRIHRLIPIVPVGLRYDGNHPVTVHIAFGKPVTSNGCACRQEFVRRLEERVSWLSGESAM